MVDVLAAVIDIVLVADGEHGIATALERLADRIVGPGDQRVEGLPFDLAALAEQLARRQVAEHHPTRRIDQHHRHRRVLHHGVEQQFALHQGEALVAQGVAESTVAVDEFAQLALSIPRNAEAVIAVAIAGHAAGQRTKQRVHRRERAADVV